MRFAFTEEQLALKTSARRFVETHCPSAHVRGEMAKEQGYDDDVWRRMSGELGWASLIIPEAYHGAACSHVELVALMEELGRGLAPSPLLATLCLGATAILAAGSDEQKAEYLPLIASGELTAALAELRDGCARRDADGSWSITGDADFVVDGHTAQLLIVAVPEQATGDCLLFALPAASTGVSRKLQATMDQTRKLAHITCHEVQLPARALLADGAAAAQALAHTLDLARIALAAEQLGGAEHCLDMAVAYAKERHQFGRPIGSFQAIKHKCADMLVLLESARSATYYAAWVASHRPEERATAAAVAKISASRAFFRCAAENIQIHGGIGFTWEHDAHLYFKRAKASEQLLGQPRELRESLSAAVGL
jgi:alkylation response protein AidB-like acyl-CoA dehydrogenase